MNGVECVSLLRSQCLLQLLLVLIGMCASPATEVSGVLSWKEIFDFSTYLNHASSIFRTRTRSPELCHK